MLVAVGRRPNMSKVLADDCQVQLENGRPLIKGTYRTTQENVYAIGDTVARKRLAHVAASHAAYLVENLAGRGHRMQLSVVPKRYVCRASGCADLYLYGAGDCGGWIYGK